MSRTPNRQRGFSLLEMVLTITILSILAAVSAQVFGGGFSLWLEARAVTPLAGRGQLALERMVRELRYGSCQTLTRPEGAASIQVRNDLGQELLFHHMDSPVSGIHMRIDGGADHLLLDGVGAADVAFDIPQTCLVTIDFTLTGQFSDGTPLRHALRTAVQVRRP